jgi:two-component system sensor histidine kinase VicK
MVDNLLTNACKSSAAGTTINILANRETDDTGQAFLHLSVSDTGGGIAPEDRGRVFERFYRADNALVAGLGETGVGLAIVKALVEAHQGHIWIETSMGEGTTFHFTLPYGLERRMGDGITNRVVAERRPGGALGDG